MRQFFWESHQKARKQHFCDRCFHNIYPGEYYKRYIWKPGPGKFFVMHEHEHPTCPLYHEDMVYVEEPVSLRMAVCLEVTEVLVRQVDGTVRLENKVIPVNRLVSDDEMPPTGTHDLAPDEEVPF